MAEAENTDGQGPRGASFASVDRLRWQEKLAKDLKGKTATDLTWTDVSGLEVHALYDEVAAHIAGGLAGLGSSWQVCVLIDHQDPKEAQRAALEAQRGGAEAVSLKVASSSEGGVVFSDVAEFNCFCSALSDCGLDIHLQPGLSALSLREGLGSVSSMGLDPFSAMARGAAWSDARALMDLAFAVFDDESAQGALFEVDSTTYHGAGASHALELGLALASGVFLLREASKRGLDLEDIARLITFRVAVGTDFFSSIAKLRAARLGWRQVCEAVNVDAKMLLHASASELHQTLRGRWVNTLRSTAYCFAGAVGGADRITLLSHEHGLATRDALGERIARNTQLVLRLESGLDQVRDPAAGSYYLESLTDATAQKAWQVFQAIEEQGGIVKAVETGWVAERIHEDRERRLDDVATAAAPILGVSLYPAPDEDMAVPARGDAQGETDIVTRPLSWDVKGEGA